MKMQSHRMYSFSVWVLLLGVIILRLTHVVVHVHSSFVAITEEISPTFFLPGKKMYMLGQCLQVPRYFCTEAPTCRPVAYLPLNSAKKGPGHLCAHPSLGPIIPYQCCMKKLQRQPHWQTEMCQVLGCKTERRGRADKTMLFVLFVTPGR